MVLALGSDGEDTRVCMHNSVLSLTGSFFLGNPGSKVADPCCYGHTQFHLLPDKLKRERFIKNHLEDQIEVVYRSNGIASLFAWTAAQAMYQGEIVSLTIFSWLRMCTAKFINLFSLLPFSCPYFSGECLLRKSLQKN